jgi:thiol-disulfide isomerase/thioredoxin
MRRLRSIAPAGILTSLIACLGMAAMSPAQDAKQQPEPSPPGVLLPSTAGESLKSINDDYQKQLVLLDHRRLESLERLAARQAPAEASATYEHLFHLAITGNLFREAEPAARAVLSGSRYSASAMALAHLVKMIAEVDRKAFEPSLESLRQAIAEQGKEARPGFLRGELSTDELVGICDAYYQRLIHDGQYEIARKAMRLVLDQTRRPVLKEFLSGRLRRLEVVGKPAPGIKGTDLDGRPFDLSAEKGKVVLVVFWASWCLPCAAEIDALQDAEESFRGRSLEIVGINLDASPAVGPKAEAVLPNIRRFVLDHNVRWPTLVNGEGEKDYARAYGVTEIPANILVARDGKIASIDLVPKNLESTIARAVGE